MPSETPSRDSIFSQAITIPSAEERAGYITRACGDDVELRRAVERLVAAHFRAGGFLEQPAVAVVDTGAYTPSPGDGASPTLAEGPGTRIGPYNLMEPIGEGGFGVVFKAEQTHPRRKVALKVIKPGMDSRQVIARFEAEQQALALMDHPHIATVLDAGETATGRPYFVMELVEGTPLTDFCDQNRLTVRERLELFVSVCKAVQHAHQKGIIHRDLKPSNILVTCHDGATVPKVIDFGIAKATGQQLTDKTLLTGCAQMIGTPLYMSPEQAGLGGLDVDTRSDVYSLGVVLYELLTGATPFDQERMRQADYDELRRIIREEEPPRPSRRVGTPGGKLPEIAERRRIDPARLPRRLRGELDWIVMMCLEKDRNRRYETAIALADDVRHYLNDEPVRARPPSTGYRLSKFLRRNRGPVLVTAFVFLALVLGIVGTTVGLIRADRAASQERKARDRLRKAFVRQLKERLQSDLEALEKVGHTVEAGLAAREQWEEGQIVAFLEPLLRQEDRLFGLGLAFEPFHVPHTRAAPAPPVLAVSTAGLLASAAGPGPLLATSAQASRGYCLYVYRDGGIRTAHYPSCQYDHRRKDWFKVPLTEGQAFWTPITGLDKEEWETFKTALISYVVPLRRKGEVVGVMCVDISMKDFFADNKLDNWLKDLDFGKPSYAFVVSNSQKKWNGMWNRGKGIFISHPNLDDARFQYPKSLLGLKGLTPEFKALARRMVAGETGTGVAEDPWTKKQSTFLFTPVQSEKRTAEWTLVVVIDEGSSR